MTTMYCGWEYSSCLSLCFADKKLIFIGICTELSFTMSPFDNMITLVVYKSYVLVLPAARALKLTFITTPSRETAVTAACEWAGVAKTGRAVSVHTRASSTWLYTRCSYGFCGLHASRGNWIWTWNSHQWSGVRRCRICSVRRHVHHTSIYARMGALLQVEYVYMLGWELYYKWSMCIC